MELTAEILDEKLQAFEQRLEQRLEQKFDQKLDQKLTETKNDIIKWVVGVIFATTIIMVSIINFYTSAVALVTQ